MIKDVWGVLLFWVCLAGVCYLLYLGSVALDNTPKAKAHRAYIKSYALKESGTPKVINAQVADLSLFSRGHQYIHITWTSGKVSTYMVRELKGANSIPTGQRISIYKSNDIYQRPRYRWKRNKQKEPEHDTR